MSTAVGFSATAEQRRIIEDHPLDVPAIVDAGAGTGKTEVIVQRVLHLVSTGRCAPEQILLLTFARKAAAELRRRVRQSLGPTSKLPHCSTFHSFAWELLLEFCYEIGMSPDAAVVDEPEAKLFFRRTFEAWIEDPASGAQAFPLRPFRRLEICDALFTICSDLKSEGTAPDAFRARAIRAADAFAGIAYREIREPYRKPYRGADYRLVASVTDARLAAEIADEKARASAAAELFDRYQSVLDAAAVLTYADLLDRAERALRSHPALGRILRARYVHCIVDEYQDTDAGQHRFLTALFPGLRGVAALGDVRQSIYGFRGAKPENLESFKSTAGCSEYALTLNRRSVQEILDLAGAAIGPHAPDRKLVAHRGEAGAQVIHVASTWAQTGETLYADESREREAAYVAAQVAALISSGRAPRDIAILSRNKTKVQPLTGALLEERVPFQLVGGVGFYDAPEVLDAVAWLKLLADPFDGQALARAAASPGIGISDAALALIAAGSDRDRSVFVHRLVADDLPAALDGDDRARVERLRRTLDLIEPFAAMPLAVSFDAVMDRTGLRASWELSDDPHAPQALANLRKLAAVIREFCKTVPALQAADFVLLLHDLELVEIDEREAGVGDANAVSIMTVHAAKGLEWPIVFITGVWPDNNKSAALGIDTATGALICREAADGSEPFHSVAVRLRADADGVVTRAEDRRADPARDLEELRLFYVALTRARDELFVTGILRHGSAHRFLRFLNEFAAQRGWATDEPRPSVERIAAPVNGRTVSAQDGPASDLSGAIPALMPSFAAPIHRTTLSFSAIQYFEQCPRRSRYAVALRLPQCSKSVSDGPAMDSAADELSRDSLASAGDFGRLVHRALELWAIDRRANASMRAALEQVRAAARDLQIGLDERALARAETSVASVTNLLSGWTPLHVEAPFAIEFGGGSGDVVTGFIDLIAIDPQGRAAIVDYKTGTGRPPNDYALQLALYRDAARRAYGIATTAAVIVRVGDRTASLESVDPIDEEIVRARVAKAAAGIRAGDDTPKAGEWCWTCPYRAAPCGAYPGGRDA